MMNNISIKTVTTSSLFVMSMLLIGTDVIGWHGSDNGDELTMTAAAEVVAKKED